MKRCSKCILPVNLPGLTIYGDSHCNYCKAFEEKTKNYSDPSQQEMKKRFEKIGVDIYDKLGLSKRGHIFIHPKNILKSTF